MGHSRYLMRTWVTYCSQVSKIVWIFHNTRGIFSLPYQPYKDIPVNQVGCGKIDFSPCHRYYDMLHIARLFTYKCWKCVEESLNICDVLTPMQTVVPFQKVYFCLFFYRKLFLNSLLGQQKVYSADSLSGILYLHFWHSVKSSFRLHPDVSET